jgi:hypothetical protein
MARKKKHEEHVNAEAWAIPYGDLVTLSVRLVHGDVRHVLGQRGQVSRAVGLHDRRVSRCSQEHASDQRRRENGTPARLQGDPPYS